MSGSQTDALPSNRQILAREAAPVPILPPRRSRGAYPRAGRPLAVDATAAGPHFDPEGFVAAAAGAVAPPQVWERYFAQNSRSFSFASRWFRRSSRRLVQEVYAFCRFTDDLADQGWRRPDRLDRALEAWRWICGEAYEGRTTGVQLADRVMSTMARREVPFEYAADLIAGARSDLQPVRMATLPELRRYTYKVASVVGLWIAQLFGVRDPWMLSRAESLGHAMQVTNILRDVGEDLEAGRIYLPHAVMKRHGIGLGSLIAMRDIRYVTTGYVDLVEELMGHAEDHYALAWEAIPPLPRELRGPVAIAADVYQGIHARIRKNGYDNLTRRARTSRSGKVVYGARAWARASLRRARPSRSPSISA